MKSVLSFATLLCLLSTLSLSAAQPVAIVKGQGATVTDGKVSVDITLVLTGATIADIELFDSSITTFTSDKGDDCGTKPEGIPDYSTVPYYSMVESLGGWDGSPPRRKITIRSPQKVSDAASTFTLAGELVITHAESLETNTITSLNIANGTELVIGGVSGVIKEVERGGEDMEFRMEFANVPEGFEFEDVDLTDLTGEDLRGSRNTQKSKFGDGPESMEMWFYGVKPPLTTLNMEYGLWKNLRTMRIPYHVTVTTGEQAAVEVSVPVSAVSSGSSTAPLMRREENSPPLSVTVAPTESIAVSAWPTFKISGIAGSGKSGMVFVDGKMLKTGDSVPGTSVKILSIEGDKVTLSMGGATKTLRSGETLK